MIYAIDYGTSNSLLTAASLEGVTAPLALDPDAEDPTVFRSVLYFPSHDRCFYGARAVREFAAQDMEGRFIRSIKKYLPIRSFVGTWVEERPLNLEDIIALFLKEMRTRANEKMGRDVDAVVLGRPARFSDDEATDTYAQSRLEMAARNAGFKHISFCPEPVAAAFEFKNKLTETKTVLVGDFGGGTSDFTVIRIGPGEFRNEDVLAIGGVSLAGDALDGALMRKRISPYFGSDVVYKVPFGSNVLKMPVSLVEKICSPADIVLLRKRDTMEFFKNVREWSLRGTDRVKMDRLFCLIEDQLGFPLFEEIDRTKRKLSSAPDTSFELHYPGVDVSHALTRADFEAAIADRVEEIVASLDDTIRAAQVRFEDIDIVCCTGGTAKVPAISDALKARFGAEKLTQHNHFHSVVQGLGEKAKTLL